MKIIEIRKTNIGEVAYLFSNGKIYKVLVEDLTGKYVENETRPVFEEDIEEETAPRRRIAPRQKGELTLDDIPDDLPLGPRREEISIPEIGQDRPKPKGPAPKGIPRNMADIFRKPPELS
jgi:hypothetical protein